MPWIVWNAPMKLPLSTRKKESNSTTIRDFVRKMWRFPHPQSAILLLELVHPPGSRSKGRIAVCGGGKRHIFSTKSRTVVEFDSLFRIESGEFMDASRVIRP